MSQSFDLTDLSDALLQSTERIIFQVYHDKDMVFRYRTSFDIKMAKVLRFHARQRGVPANTWDFWYNGRIVYGYETPGSLRLRPEAVLIAVFPDPGGPSSQPLAAMIDGQVEEEVGGYAGYKEANDGWDERMPDKGYEDGPLRATPKYFVVGNDESSPDGYSAGVEPSEDPPLGSHEDGFRQDDHGLTGSCSSYDYFLLNSREVPQEEDTMMVDEVQDVMLSNNTRGVIGMQDSYPDTNTSMM